MPRTKTSKIKPDGSKRGSVGGKGGKRGIGGIRGRDFRGRDGFRGHFRGGRVIAKPEVLARFTDEQLAAMEKRASREIPPAELKELEALADAAFERVQSVEAVLRALRAARLKQGISQAELDALTGIGRANISRLENLHLDNPTFETVLRYAQAVGMKLSLQPADKAA